MQTRADVMVCIPSTDVWKSDFGMALLGLAMDFSRKIEGYDWQYLRFFKKEGSLLPSMRHKMVRRAIAKGCTHVLFLDSDQWFPPETLRQLLKHGKDFVACNVATKRDPAAPTARDKLPGNPKGKLVYTLPGMKGLRQVWRIGFGVALVSTFIFTKLPLPWFPIDWKQDRDDFQGEDWGFCAQMEKIHCPLFIDQDLSWEIGHIGKKIYKHEDVELPPEFVDVVLPKLKEAANAESVRAQAQG